MQRKYYLLTSLIFIVVLYASCASRYHMPESFEDKMNRFKSRTTHTNKMPDFLPTNKTYAFSGKRNYRGLASVKNTQEKKIQNLTTKKLYFLTMLSQLEKMSCFFKKTDAQNIQINHCPKFHNAFLKYKKTHLYTGSENVACEYIAPESNMINHDFLVKNPEYLLKPSSKDNLLVKDLITNKEVDKNKVIITAIKQHAHETHKEITELCEYGASSNSYVFENLVSFSKTSKVLRPGQSAVMKLLRNPVYANMYLLNSIDKKVIKKYTGARGPASVSSKMSQLPDTYDNEVINRMGTHWAQNYFEFITK